MKKEVKKSGKKFERYKAVIFDLGGVLSLGKKVNEMEGVHEEVAKALKFSTDAYFDAIDSTYSDAIEGKISRQKSINIMAKNLNTTPKKLVKVYTKFYRKNFKRNMKLYRFALRLKKAGYKIGIISDIWYVAKDVFFYEDYYKNFDVVLASCDIGSRKSSKKIFQVAAKKLRLSPKEIIFTDNNSWNLTAPKKMGIETIKFENNEQLVKKLRKLGVKI